MRIVMPTSARPSEHNRIGSVWKLLLHQNYRNNKQIKSNRKVTELALRVRIRVFVAAASVMN